jgi:hypothetical protein
MPPPAIAKVSAGVEVVPLAGGRAAARGASTGKAKGRQAAAAVKTLRGVSSVAANVLGGLASLFESLFGGARTPEQIEQAKFDERNAIVTPAATPASSAGPQQARQRGADDEVEAFLAAERQQRAALQAWSRLHGHEIISEEQARSAEETAKKKDRGRDGGQSL